MVWERTTSWRKQLWFIFILLFAGLLDVPICAVNDDGYFANPRYSLQFPPNAHNQKKLQRIPVNAINVNSQLHPINTVTGLQYFTGLTNYPFRERAIPKVGLGKCQEVIFFTNNAVYLQLGWSFWYESGKLATYVTKTKTSKVDNIILIDENFKKAILNIRKPHNSRHYLFANRCPDVLGR